MSMCSSVYQVTPQPILACVFEGFRNQTISSVPFIFKLLYYGVYTSII